MKWIAVLGLLALLGCSHTPGEVRQERCDDGTTIVVVRHPHAWTLIRTGEPLPDADAPVWHVTEPPRC